MQSDVYSVWQKCLYIIKNNLSPESFNNWFKPIKPIRLNKNKLTIRVPSPYFYEYIEENYIDLIRRALKNVIGSNAKLEYEIKAIKNKKSKKNNTGSHLLPVTSIPLPENKAKSIPMDASQLSNPLVIPGIKKSKINSNLKPEYNFENFIEGNCNKAAREAGLKVSEKLGMNAFNPLMIFGPVGTGKTHLIHAIGIRIKENFPNETVLYISANKFEDHFTRAVTSNNKHKFIEYFQMIDVLIIDDVHEFATKEKTQLAFFHIFNNLHQQNKQIVLTSDRPPVELQGIQERLLSRFKWGTTVELSNPDFETRLKIIKHKAYLERIEISDKVIQYIADKVNTNIRELEGVLHSLVTYSTLNGHKKICLDLACNIMKQIIKENKRELTIEYIVNVVADYFDIEVKVIKSKAKSREIAEARHIAMYLSRNFTDASLPRIGTEIGGRKHSTVYQACKKVQKLLKTNKNFKQRVDSIINRFKY